MYPKLPTIESPQTTPKPDKKSKYSENLIPFSDDWSVELSWNTVQQYNY